jgi:hypothetical protein
MKVAPRKLALAIAHLCQHAAVATSTQKIIIIQLKQAPGQKMASTKGLEFHSQAATCC